MTATEAAALGLALCAGPYFAVESSSRSRPFAALSDVSSLCAAVAALIAAAAITIQLSALQAPFAVLAPPSIAAAPWAAGELCAGPSARQDQAFAAALLAAYLAAILTEIASASLLARALLTGAAALGAYLSTRGSVR
ncbi:MAG TPA: hypothetical protein VFA79_20210 [Myxococcales bacterium]|nr:hypothetical protein [Myxococcales bacterium]